jgi:hypothetical protein
MPSGQDKEVICQDKEVICPNRKAHIGANSRLAT